MVARLGYRFELELARAGFYPEGGGEVTIQVHPAAAPAPVRCTSRGTLLDATVLSVVGGVPAARAVQLGERAVRRLRERGVLAEAENLPVLAPRSHGAAVLVLARFENALASFYEPSEGKAPLQAADRAAASFHGFMERGGAVDKHLGDQLLLPLAIAAAGLQGGTPTPGHYSTEEVTPHLLTHVDIVQRFLDVRVSVRGELGEEGEVVVAPAVKVEAG
jgi:RNA 3'-terminal phosphate cyclase (ATP)